jgi:hypothetical protein
LLLVEGNIKQINKKWYAIQLVEYNVRLARRRSCDLILVESDYFPACNCKYKLLLLLLLLLLLQYFIFGKNFYVQILTTLNL